MALPLPSSEQLFPAGGQLVRGLGGINALTKSAAEAQYAPYTEYSNALSKMAYANMLPYQIRATMLSNTMLWMALKDHPEVIQNMMTEFGKSIPQGNAVTGNVPIPPPSGGPMGGLLGNLINPFLQKLGIGGGGAVSGGTPQNAMSNMPNPSGGFNPFASSSNEPYSPNVPSSGMGGLYNKQTGQYSEQIHKPGTTYRDPTTGQIYSTPTEKTMTASQTAIGAAQRVEPQLKRLADAAGPFLSGKGIAMMQAQRAYNLTNPKTPGELPTKYAEFQSILKAAPEALVKSYGLNPTNETIERMQHVIEPYYGETGAQYKSRILAELQHIKQEQEGISQRNLSQSFKLTGAPNSVSNEPPMSNQEVMQHLTPSEQKLAQELGGKIKVEGPIKNKKTGKIEIKQGYIPADELETYQSNGFKKV